MRYLLVSALTMLPLAAHAEFSLSFGSWNYGVSGQVGQFDLREDLDVAARERSFYQLRWDTPGNWPDLALNHAPVKASGSGLVTEPGTLGGVPIGSESSTTSGDADIQDYDLGLSYPWTLGSVRMHAGLLVKRLDGEVLVRDEDGSDTVRQAVDETFPMGQLQAQIPLTTNLRLELLGNYVAYRGNSAAEQRVQLRALLGPFSLSLGWQAKDYELQGERFDLDTRLDGGFVSFGLLMR